MFYHMQEKTQDLEIYFKIKTLLISILKISDKPSKFNKFFLF